jgi:hypothetical protein
MLRLLAQRSSLTQNEPGAQEKEADATRTAGREAAPSWDLSKIPVFSSGRAERFQMPSIFPAPRLPIQAKLKVGQVDDPLEHEADRVADQVMRMPAPEVSIAAAPPQISRKCAACEEEQQTLQTKRAPSANAEAALDAGAGLRTTERGGEPLPSALRSYFEPRFGRDFSRVRVHADGEATTAARAVQARAYTFGRDIVFGSGEYAPATADGKRLLAHELTHVVQNGSSTASSTIRRKPETWYRGEGTGVQPAEPGGVVHDFGDGLYLTDDPAVAARYAATRAVSLKGSTPSVTAATFERSLLGKVLDLTTDVRWKQYLAEGIAGRTNEGLIKLANENYWPIFKGFLEKYNLHLEDFDTIIGQEFVRGGNQICIRNPTIAASMRQMLTTYVPPAEPVAGAVGEKPVAEGGAEKVVEGVKGTAPAETPTTVKVDSTVNVLKSTTNADGTVISEVEVQFHNGIERVNGAAPEGGQVPQSIKFRLTQNANGSFSSAEPLAGEPAPLVEALGRQIVTETVNAAGSGAAGAVEGASVSVATKALPYVRTGLKWGGPALFVIVTGYQLITATPQQRPRVLAKAAGGLVGGVGSGFLVCNVLLDVETGGWGIILCGLLAGGAGGYAGSEAAGAVYDAANPPPGLTEMEKALLEMEQQPNNVKALFYTMIHDRGASGIAMTPEFVHQFIFTVPRDLDTDELYMLAGQLQGVTGTDTLQSIIDNLGHAIYQLPRRKPKVKALPPMLNIQDVMELNPSLRYRLDAPGSGTIRVFPGYNVSPIDVPGAERPGVERPGVVPLLEIRIPHT